MVPPILLLAAYFAYDQREACTTNAGKVLSFGADVAYFLPATRRLAVLSMLRGLGAFIGYGALFVAVALPAKDFANPAAVALRTGGPNVQCFDSSHT